VEVSKIGRQIAEEVLDLQRRDEDSSSNSSPGPMTEPGLLNIDVGLSYIIPISELFKIHSFFNTFYFMIKVTDHNSNGITG